MVAASEALVWDDRFRRYDFGPGHPFTEESRWLAVKLAEASGLFDGTEGGGPVIRISHVEPASRADLLRFHEEDYLALVERVSGLRHGGSLDAGDTPSFPGCFDSAARIVGGSLAALRAVETEQARRSFHPAGGLHHAHPDRASGFCIFNDLAIAIRTWLASGGRGRRVAYLDIDAHHGDGVMYGFFEDGRVLDVDFHQDGRTLFPGTGFPSEIGRGDGAGLKINVPLPPAAGDEAFLPLFDRIVPRFVREFRPDLIVLQHGVDAHGGDRLAQLQLTDRAYQHALASAIALSHELCGDRLLVSGGGGYSAQNVALVLARAALMLAGRTVPDSAALPAVFRKTFEETTAYPAPHNWSDKISPPPSAWSKSRETDLLTELSRSLGTKV